MPDVNQLFRAATQNARPAPGALARQLEAQRRRARNRKTSALAIAAVIVAAIALFAATALNRGKDGSAPASVEPGNSGVSFTIVGLDGEIRSTIPDLPRGAAMPDVSPDGTSIAFTVQDGSVSRIAVMRLDGTGLHVITSGPISAERPRWSPDGSRLLFYRSQRKSGLLRLMEMNADGTDVRWIRGTSEIGDQTADWSPDGSLILYPDHSGSQRHLATVPASGGRFDLISTGRAVVGDGTWSPDGRSIAFKRLNGPLGILDPTSNANYELWLMNSDGSGRHRLVTLPSLNAEAPEWSPDGTKIAFIGSVDGVGGIQSESDAVYVVDVATGDVTEVFAGVAVGAGHDSRATWLPDGNALLVMTETP